MRKAALALILIFVAGAAGLILAGIGAAPAVGVAVGLCLVAGVIAALGVSTDDLALGCRRRARVHGRLERDPCRRRRLRRPVHGARVRRGAGARDRRQAADAASAVGCSWPGSAAFSPACCRWSSLREPMSCSARSSPRRRSSCRTGTSAFAAIPPGNVSTLVKYELSLVLIPLLIAAVGNVPDAVACVCLNLWAAGAVINACVAVADYAGWRTSPRSRSPHTDPRG